MIHRFYLAAPFTEQARMREYRDELVAQGHLVTSRWIDALEVNDFDTNMAKHAGIGDLRDIDSCWAVLLFTDKPSTTGGMHVEFGYAMARGRTTAVIGPLLHIFHKQATHHYKDWNDFRQSYPW